MHRSVLVAALCAPVSAALQPIRAVPEFAVAARARHETGDDVPGATYEKYEHDGWTCGYRHKSGCEPAIVLLHPVGIGLSSWFWTRVMAEPPPAHKSNAAAILLELLAFRALSAAPTSLPEKASAPWRSSSPPAWTCD